MPKDPHITGGIRHDWAAIKHEYVTDPNASLRKIAKKYGVSLNTIAKKSKAEDWFATRKKTQTKIVTKGITKTVNKMADELSKESDFLERMKGHMEKMLQDDMQFQRHLIETRVIDEDGSMIVSPEEKIFNKFDSKSMKDSMQILKMMEDMTRSLKNIQKAESIQKQQLDRERFEFEKEMALKRLELDKERIALERERNALRSGNMGDGEDTYGVVILPEILPEVMPNE
jgi:LysM repeat protein